MLPLARSTQTNWRLTPPVLVQQETKTLLPTMMGLESPAPGRVNFHLRFFLSLHSVGTLSSSLMPVPFGPRKLGQSPARLGPTNEMSSTQADRRDRMSSLHEGIGRAADDSPRLSDRGLSSAARPKLNPGP